MLTGSRLWAEVLIGGKPRDTALGKRGSRSLGPDRKVQAFRTSSGSSPACFRMARSAPSGMSPGLGFSCNVLNPGGIRFRGCRPPVDRTQNRPPSVFSRCPDNETASRPTSGRPHHSIFSLSGHAATRPGNDASPSRARQASISFRATSRTMSSASATVGPYATSPGNSSDVARNKPSGSSSTWMRSASSIPADSISAYSADLSVILVY